MKLTKEEIKLLAEILDHVTDEMDMAQLDEINKINKIIKKLTKGLKCLN